MVFPFGRPRRDYTQLGNYLQTLGELIAFLAILLVMVVARLQRKWYSGGESRCFECSVLSRLLCVLVVEPSVSFYSREGWLQGGLREPSFTYFTHGSMHTCLTRVHACPSNNIEKCERVPTSFNLQESLLSSRGIVSR